MRQHLKIAVTTTCLVACMALVGLWLRSYATMDMTQGHFKATGGFGVDSVFGRITVVSYRNTHAEALMFPWRWWRETLRDDRPQVEGWSSWGFYKSKSIFLEVSFPHWFPATIFLLLAAATWLDWRRFTVGRLLAVMTVLAVLLGAAIAVK